MEGQMVKEYSLRNMKDKRGEDGRLDGKGIQFKEYEV